MYNSVFNIYNNKSILIKGDSCYYNHYVTRNDISGPRVLRINDPEEDIGFEDGLVKIFIVCLDLTESIIERL